MRVLIGNFAGRRARAIMKARPQIGQLLSPVKWQAPYTDNWATDNDVYANKDDPGWWRKDGERRWLQMLDKIVPIPTTPMFVLLPDVCRQWDATLARAYHYRKEVSDRHLPVGLALQDGCDFEEVLAFAPDWVFIGGSLEWKWRTVPEAVPFFHARGIRVHIGQVSGPVRMRAALTSGADSCDGTGWARFKNNMLPALFAELDQLVLSEASTEREPMPVREDLPASLYDHPENEPVAETARTLYRAQTLFDIDTNPEEPHKTYTAVWLGQGRYRVDKVGKEGFEDRPVRYTNEGPYTVDTEARTCTCPYHAGKDAYTSKKGVAVAASPARLYCKHRWAINRAVYLLEHGPGVERTVKLLGEGWRLDQLLHHWEKREKK